MDTEVLGIFQQEVERQCKFALIAADDMWQSVPSHNMDRIWYSAQAFLVAVGNVSKLLWPPKPQFSKRGDELRASLKVPEDSPLQPRKFRNHFEHFDERLDKWAASSARHDFADSNVAMSPATVGFDPRDCLRNLDTEKGAITFQGEEYRISPIVEAMRELSRTASIEVAKLDWG